MLRRGVDIVTVAGLIVHHRLGTTRLFTLSLPTEWDLKDAVAKLSTDQ